MTSRLYDRAKEIFLAVREHPPEERPVFVARACEEDEALRLEVESLLGHYDPAPDPVLDDGPQALLTRVPDTIVGETITHYRLVRLLGTGGMGQVFEAEDLRLARRVALKFLHPSVAGEAALRARFEREARAASALDHTNICTIYEIDESEDGRLFIAMALYRGETLKQRLTRGRLGVGEALSVALQTARGLNKAHQVGVVHRDVKPANLFITMDASVKILDFGLAKLAGRRDLSKTGMAMGTVAYMSPEQARGETVDHRSDIWSLGVVLYEMLVGQLPFRAEHPQGVIRALLQDDPKPLAPLRLGVDEALERVVMRALAKSPRDRYPRTADLLQALRSLGSETFTATLPPPPPSVPGSRSSEDGSSTFVAREAELEKLDGFLERVLGARGQVAFVTGEAGSGKTTLLIEFARRSQRARPDLIVAGGVCNAYTGPGDPYLPFCQALGLLTGDVECGWAAQALIRDQTERLWELLPNCLEELLSGGRGLIDTFLPAAALLARAEARTAGRPRWLAELKRVIEGTSGATGSQPPTQTDLFEQYARVLLGVAQHHPILLLLDDLQWADAGSLGLLFHLGRRLRRGRILLVGAYRPSEVALGREGERHPLEPVLSEFKRSFGDVELDLDRSEGRRFVDALLDTRPNRLDAGFRETLYQQTRGHALHTVELVREMKERQALVKDDAGCWTAGPRLDWAAVPARVEAVVAERVERVPGELREMLFLAAVEGEEFTAEALARAAGQSDLETVRRLSAELDHRHRLVRSLGVRRLDGQRLSLYRFRHNLFQKYLYGILTPAERAYLHERVGRVLEALYGERAPEISVHLAHHFVEAGLRTRAAAYLRRAGEKAVRASACQEAIGHFAKGLELLEGVPGAAERDRLELDLLVGLGPVQMAVKGWTAPSTGQTYKRARLLARQLGQTRKLVPALWGMWQFTKTNAELATAGELADQLLELSRSAEDPGLLMTAHQAIGETAFWSGDLATARHHSQRAFQLYEPERDGHLGFAYGLDPGVTTLGFWAWSLWCLGFPEQALEEARRGAHLAEELAHPFSLGLARYFMCICHHARREPEAAESWAESCLEVAREEEFETLLAMGALMRGWARSKRGLAERGVEEMDRAMERLPRLARPWFLSLVAEGRRQLGDDGAALVAVEDGLTTAEQTGNRMWNAELYRMRGELLTVLDRAEEAEASFRRAVEVAVQQGARSQELRALTSWAGAAGCRGDAFPALAELLSKLPEGRDTIDLRAAQAVLESAPALHH